MGLPRRTVIFAGAPEATALDWDERRLPESLSRPFERFLDPRSQQHVTSSDVAPSASLPRAVWRRPAVDKADYHKHHAREDADAVRFQARPVDGDEDYETFLEQSLAAVDDLDSSQIAPGTMLEDEIGQSTFLSADSTVPGMDTTLVSFDTSNLSDLTESTVEQTETLVPSLRQLPLNGGITDLKHIPTADYLQRIHPATPTVNLLVGIVSISPARTVRLRKRNGAMDIVEVVVGDETRAGFILSFWLVPEESQRPAPSDDLRPVLRGLRSGNVLLVRNVALSSFRGRVYGQSLNRRFARNSTGVSKLRVGSGAEEEGVPNQFREKRDRVIRWRDDFVGDPRAGREAAKQGNGHKHMTRRLDDLPPDTQD